MGVEQGKLMCEAWIWYNRSSDHWTWRCWDQPRIENCRFGKLGRSSEPRVILVYVHCRSVIACATGSCLLTSGICIASYHAATPWQMLLKTLLLWANFLITVSNWSAKHDFTCIMKVLFHKPFRAQLKGLVDNNDPCSTTLWCTVTVACLGRFIPYSGLFSWGANFRYFRDSSTSHEILHPRNFQPIIALCNTYM